MDKLNSIFVVLLALLLPLTAQSAPQSESRCLKESPRGYDFIGRENGMDKYLSKSINLVLIAKCEPRDQTFAKIHEALSKNFKLVSLKNLAFYFETDAAGVISRSYFIPTEPVKQISFVTKQVNSRFLVATESLIDDLSKEK